MSTSNETSTIPNFIDPISIDKMTDEQIDVMLDGIRARRMKKYELYKETLELKTKAAAVALEEKLDKKLAAFKKQLDVVDKAFEKLEKYVNEVRALRLMLGEKP